MVECPECHKSIQGPPDCCDTCKGTRKVEMPPDTMKKHSRRVAYEVAEIYDCGYDKVTVERLKEFNGHAVARIFVGDGESWHVIYVVGAKLTADEFRDFRAAHNLCGYRGGPGQAFAGTVSGRVEGGLTIVGQSGGMDI